MSLAQPGRERPTGLTDDLEVVHDPYLQERFVVEGAPSSRCTFLNPIDCLEDVLKTLEVAPQRATASARTRSRTRGRKPCSVATSTLQPRSASSSIMRAA